jgi:hypothetical protein
MEEAADPSNAFASVERLIADMSKHVRCLFDHRFGTLEHALTSLGESRNGADRLIQLVSDSARHFL